MSPNGQTAYELWKKFTPLIKKHPGKGRVVPFFIGIVASAFDAGNCFGCILIMKRNITMLNKAEKKRHNWNSPPA